MGGFLPLGPFLQRHCEELVGGIDIFELYFCFLSHGGVVLEAIRVPRLDHGEIGGSYLGLGCVRLEVKNPERRAPDAQ
jgi:hypothetical protein